MGVPFRHKFSSDNCPKCRKTISCNNEPEILYPDMLTRDIDECPHADVYITGFPCQPFSAAGKQQGFEDTKGRGRIFFHVLEYIKVKNPKIFILENVKGLVTLEKGM
jgi:DNA (cytosine-5)-methyltransferase 1